VRLSASAPCKINRELRVGRLRPDGYHEVLSRMATIDLADTLTAEESDGSSSPATILRCRRAPTTWSSARRSASRRPPA
jgi:4-diphosphocytidyl-2C-methyl-D-erythritol kinase